MLLTKSILFDPAILNNVQVLVVDNDRDSSTLYTALLEKYNVAVITATSVQEALECLNHSLPDLVICEVTFLGESVYPLIHQVRRIEQNTHKVIPICVISTCPVTHLAEYLKVKVEAYQIKPIDLKQLLEVISGLILLAKTTQPLRIQDYLERLNLQN